MPAVVLAVAPGAAHAWPGSPEGPERMAACLRGLRSAGVADVSPDGERADRCGAGVRFLPGPHGPPPAAALAAVHPPAYLAALAAVSAPVKVADEDDDVEFTYATPSTSDAALAAAGAVCAVVDAVCAPAAPPATAGGADRPARPTGLALVRPPGHHAGPGSGPDLAASAGGGGPPAAGGRAPSGFCFLSNVAVGAAHAAAAHGASRPLVVDLDVHVGDGTQASLPPGALVIDTHQAGVWPFDTGAPDDTGPPGGPAVVNVPLPPGSGDAAARAAYARVIEPAARRFGPDIIFVSLGFDAHAADPLGRLAWRSGTYAFLVRQLAALAADLAGGRLVLVLEGGYSAAGLERGCAAVGAALLGVPPPCDPSGEETDVDEEGEAAAAGGVEAALADAVARHGL